MKIKRTVAALLCAALTLSACGALVACGGDRTGVDGTGDSTAFDLSNYAIESTVKDSSKKTKLERISSADNKLAYRIDTNFMIFSDTSMPAKYSVFFMQLGTVMNFDEQPIVEWYDNDISILHTKRTNTSGAVEHAFYLSDGTMLFDYARYYSTGGYNFLKVSMVNRYEGDNRIATPIISMTANIRDVDKPITKYYKTDDKTNDFISYIEVDKSNLHEKPTYLEYDHTVGSVSGLTAITYTDADLEWKGNLSEYRTRSFDDTIYFYKNSEMTGSVDLSDGEALGYIGNTFYYYTIKTVALESSAYNVAVQTQGALIKGNYKLFGYDIVNNKTTELSTDIMITTLTPAYNYKTEVYDAAYITGIEKTDGIYYMANVSIDDMSEDTDDSSMYFMDSKLHNIAKIPSVLFKSGITSIYKIGDNKFHIGNYIVDGNFNYVCDASGTVYESENLVSFIHDGKKGLKDFSGKIVVEPKYYTIGNFFGGTAIATKIDGDTTVNVLLSNTGVETELPQSRRIDSTYWIEFIKPTEENGTYVVSRYEYNQYFFELYNYDGTMLKSFSGVKSNLDFVLYGNIVGINDLTKNEVYKIV